MSCGVVDEEEFCRCCRLLLQHSNGVGDGWSWEAVRGSDEGYLKKTLLRSVPAERSVPQKHKEPGSDSEKFDYCHLQTEEQEKQGVDASSDSLRPDAEEEDDGVCGAPAGSSSVLQFEYHILYSCSYRTPVLYFRASTLEGRSLTLEDVWRTVHPNYRLGLQSRPLDAITQQDGGVHEASAADGEGSKQAGKLRAVVAQRGGTHGGPGSLPGVPQTAAASPHDPPAAQSSTERLHSTTKNLVALLHLG
ncbi:ubiquitin-like-conjugating enzyme ATG10 isoform X2 [Oryzias latipes]|uniref:ubiquitin-like-conjugating enzyme ATG10 isoform X2 n=1 Tax=Oryzias latipes TaxID=8090 RepID=UPI0005CC6312|nr:ubiquitin-like-conjugating enzyme ATG10 isoform X2 [Oryzias latipes]